MNNKTKGSIVLLALIMVCTFFFIQTYAETESFKEDIFVYTVENDTITITNVENTEKKVIIPESIKGLPVVALSSGACGGNSNLEEIIIPDTVTQIGAMCFSYCTSLTNVQLPSKLTEIANGLFHQCTKLRNITIPDTVKTIEKDAFYRCNELWTVTIPENVTSIGENAFADCDNLSAATIPEKVKTIGKNAFEAHDGFRIYAKPGTSADSFAKNNRIVFEELITVSVNGTPVFFDQPPITDTKNYRTLVPMRAVLTPLGAEITWDNYFNMAGIDLLGNRLLVRIGEPFMMVNDSARYLSTPAIEFNNRTMLPIRDIVEAIGGTVNWNEETKHIDVTFDMPITE